MVTKVVSQSILDAFARVLGLLDQTRDELDSTIGQLGALTTVEKDNVVGAVNEVNDNSVSKLAKDQVTFDLSYQLLTITNKGCVVEGGYLPVYQLSDPTFRWANTATVTARPVDAGQFTTVNLGKTVVANASNGEVRIPKPSEFIVPDGVTVSVEANGDVVAKIMHESYRKSTIIPVKLKSTNSTKSINFVAEFYLTPDEFMEMIEFICDPNVIKLNPVYRNNGAGCYIVTRGKDYVYRVPKPVKFEYIATIRDNNNAYPEPSESRVIRLTYFSESKEINETTRDTSVPGQVKYTFTGHSPNAGVANIIGYGVDVGMILGPLRVSGSNNLFERPKSIRATFADGTVKERHFGENEFEEYGDGRLP